MPGRSRKSWPEDAASWLRLAEDLLRLAEDFDERAQQLHRAIEHRLAKLKPS
jgi:predicted secreted Zn-dependent protease